MQSWPPPGSPRPSSSSQGKPHLGKAGRAEGRVLLFGGMPGIGSRERPQDGPPGRPFCLAPPVHLLLASCSPALPLAPSPRRLGPRKAAALLRAVQRAGGFVESRQQVRRRRRCLARRHAHNSRRQSPSVALAATFSPLPTAFLSVPFPPSSLPLSGVARAERAGQPRVQKLRRLPAHPRLHQG